MTTGTQLISFQVIQMVFHLTVSRCHTTGPVLNMIAFEKPLLFHCETARVHLFSNFYMFLFFLVAITTKSGNAVRIKKPSCQYFYQLFSD